MLDKPTVLVLISRKQRPLFFSAETTRKLESIAHVRWNEFDRSITDDDLCELLPGVDACISSWGSPHFTPRALEKADRLRFVAYAAGSIKSVVSAEAFARGIRVSHGAATIAETVAESTILAMLVALHNVMAMDAAMKRGSRRVRKHVLDGDLVGRTVGLVGLGYVARRVIPRLLPFGVHLLIYDPFVSAQDIAALGGKKVELDEMFSTSDIVSLHAPMLPSTKHMITAHHLALLKDGAVLINTARGELIDEAALVAELRRGRIWASLDVFAQEPLPPDAELRRLPNVILSPHRAGVTNDTRLRLGKTMVDDVERFFSGAPLQFEIHGADLGRMA